MTAYECREGCPAGTWHLTSQSYERKSYFRAYDRERADLRSNNSRGKVGS